MEEVPAAELQKSARDAELKGVSIEQKSIVAKTEEGDDSPQAGKDTSHMNEGEQGDIRVKSRKT